MDTNAFLKAAHRRADLRDLADLRVRKSVLDINEVFRVFKIGRIKIIWRAPGYILYKIIVSIKSGVGYRLPGSGHEFAAALLRHIQIERFEQPSAKEPRTKIREGPVIRILPVLDMEQNVGVIQAEMIGQTQRPLSQNFFQRRIFRDPDATAISKEVKGAPQ